MEANKFDALRTMLFGGQTDERVSNFLQGENAFDEEFIGDTIKDLEETIKNVVESLEHDRFRYYGEIYDLSTIQYSDLSEDQKRSLRLTACSLYIQYQG